MKGKLDNRKGYGMEIVGSKQNHLSTGYKRVALASFVGAIVIAMMGLIGYMPGLRLLGSIHPDYIPMAPSTAISFLILSLIALVYLYQSPGERIVGLFALLVCGFVSIFGFLKCVEYFIGAETSFEQLIIRIPDRLGDIPIGIMSPSTGGGFFLAGLGVLYLILCRTDGKQIGALNNIAGNLGAVTLIIGGVFVLGYVYGQPFMYGMGDTVPMAITTAVAFVVLGVGIMAIVGPRAGLLRFVSGRSTSARLLRVFVPLVMAMVFAEDFLPDLISQKLGMRDTLVDAMLMMAYVFIAGAAAVAVGLSLGHQLEKAEEKLRDLAKFPSENPNPVLRIAKGGKLLYANKAASEVLKNWQTEVNEAVPQRWGQIVAKVFETEKSVLEEDQISDRILAFIFSPVADGGYVNLYAHDISDQKETAKTLQDKARALQNLLDELRENEERYKRLVEGSPDIVYAFSDKRGGIYYSSSAERILGYSLQHLYENPYLWNESIHLDDRPILTRTISEFAEGRNFNVEYRIRDASGNWLWFQDRSIGRRLEGNEVIIEGLATDVTEQKQIEEELQDEKAFIVSLLENLIDGFSVLDINGVHINVNPALCRMTGFTREDLIGTGPPHPYWPPEEHERIGQAFQKTMESEFGDIELTFIRKNGERFPVIVSPSAVVDEDGNISNYFATIKDITDRKQAEEELHQSEEQLRQAQKMEAVGRLAGGVAHDFNNMLGVILGHADMLLEQTDPDQPLHDDLTEIRKAAMRSADLTRQLLAFARKQTVNPRVIDLNETVAGMTKMLQRLIGEDIDLTWVPDDKLWLVNIDPSQLDQILANLCVNARDAIADVGKVTIETSNAVFDEAYCELRKGCIPGEYAMLAVNDNGCGMDSETLENIFEPFFTTKEVGEGTGLGLAMVYGVVKQNRGFIDIYSEPGLGTTFKIYLPRHRSRAAALPDNGPDAPTRCGHETILLLEDEPAILKMTTKILEKEGYKVMATSAPVEAIRLAKEYAGSIHLLLSDLVMPEMNGRDLAKHLLSLYPHLKCLFMSGYTANVVTHHGVLDEDVNFIQKPFMRSDLAAKVREVLERE